MLRATMDLLGLYRANSELFSGLVVPEGMSADVLRDNLLMETAELEIIYPDPVFMQSAIGMWAQKNYHVWEELYATLLYEYNPIWNKDGTRTETRDLAGTEDVTDGNSHSHDITSTRNLANSHDVTTTRNLAHTDDSTTTESVFGFNSSTAADANKTVFDNDTSDTGTVRDAGSGSDTGTVRDAGTSSDTRSIDRDTTDTGTITITEQGNIGVTSTQELIQRQRDVVQFNVYDYIIEEFKKRFCLMVY